MFCRCSGRLCCCGGGRRLSSWHASAIVHLTDHSAPNCHSPCRLPRGTAWCMWTLQPMCAESGTRRALLRAPLAKPSLRTWPAGGAGCFLMHIQGIPRCTVQVGHFYMQCLEAQLDLSAFRGSHCCSGLSGRTRATAGMRRCSPCGPSWGASPCKRRLRRPQRQWQIHRRRSEGQQRQRQQHRASAQQHQQQRQRRQQMRKAAAWMGQRRCCRPSS